MKMYAEIEVLGKIIRDGKNGKSYYYLNYSQDCGQVIGQLFVNEKIYNAVEVGDTCTLDIKEGNYNGKTYLIVLSVK